jgi:hypothetical protein
MNFSVSESDSVSLTAGINSGHVVGHQPVARAWRERVAGRDGAAVT